MAKGTTYVGLDVHKASIAAAVLLPRRKAEEELHCKNDKRAVVRLARKLKRMSSGDVLCCYEAGPCGYELQRQLRKNGVDCIVIAPSLIPRMPGERIKTDRKDAKKLARLLKSDMLTEVHPPTEEEEAVRDLCRCREAAKEDLKRHRQQVCKFLLRRGLVYTKGKKTWTKMYVRWLESLRFDLEADQIIFDDYLAAVEHAQERVTTLEAHMADFASRKPYHEPVEWLRTFRGIDTITAMIVVTELHDFRRFTSPRQLMAYLGLVPSERSSGERELRGRITKAGNSHVRRILVEAAWNYRHRPIVTQHLAARRHVTHRWLSPI